MVIGNILEDVLRVWKQEHEGQLPQELLIYRAGTSEGAYETVWNYLSQIDQLRLYYFLS